MFFNLTLGNSLFQKITGNSDELSTEALPSFVKSLMKQSHQLQFLLWQIISFSFVSNSWKVWGEFSFRKFQGNETSLTTLCRMTVHEVTTLYILNGNFSWPPLTFHCLGKFNNSFVLKLTIYCSRPLESIPHAVYFYFSLIFLLTRTVAILLFAASIHDESKRPIKVLRMVPKKMWCTEIERFIEEVVNGTLALSGMRFFHLTRKLILSVG